MTHLVPYPPARGVELRILQLLRWLDLEGYRVVLIVLTDSIDADALAELRKVTHTVHWTRPPLRTRLGQRFPSLRKAMWEPLKPVFKPANNQVDSGHDQKRPAAISDEERKRGLCPANLIKLVGKLARKYRPQAVIAEYIFLTPCFAALPPGSLKIVDTIDVFSRKDDQVLAFGVEDPYACTAEEERRYLLTADVVMAIQSREAELLRALAPEREVLMVGMDFEITPNKSSNSGTPDTIALVASDNALNVHGFRAFLAECWPQIRTDHPAATLHVVGTICDDCLIDDSSIRYSRWIDDLTQVYRHARVIINPTIAGTGLKIKSAQALAHGKPLVAWTNGVEGLEYAGEPPYIECHSWEEFAHAVVRLLRSADEANTLGMRARAFAEKAFGATEVYAPLKACLTGQSTETRVASIKNIRTIHEATRNSTN